MFIRHFFAAAAAAVVLAGTPGCALISGQPAAGEVINDSSITRAVKARFDADKTVNAATVNVETHNGTVLLSGFATSAAAKTQAEALARGVKGVTSVGNRIAIRP